jgi:glycosyltransferase involved in cell wall biosynthesis
MRIGIDCLRADPFYVGGLNTYVMGLLEGFAASRRGHHFQLYLTAGNRRHFARFEDRANFEIVALDGASFRRRQKIARAALLSPDAELYRRMSGWMFRSIRERMEAGSDLLYTPTVSLLCFDYRKPTLLSMHDIQHLHYPEFFSWPRLRSRTTACALSAAHAGCFQASSEFIKRDMLRHFPGISPQQIAVIPEGVNLEDFSASPAARALSQYRLPERYAFLPAQLWPHKNHITVLRALRRMERLHGVRIPLVMTGSRYSAAAAIFRYLSEEGMDYVRHLGTVPFPDLVALYRRAALVISPGLYESNSLPVLEAAAAGTAVAASDIAPNRELAQSLQLNLFDPLDEPALAECLLDLWRDQETCRRQAAHNRAAVAAFSWINAARQYLNLIERMGISHRAAPLRAAASLSL